MGNVISGCIRVQVRAYGVGSLDPQFAKRCLSCGARQYTISTTCRFCGGDCRMVSERVGATHPMPMIMAVDPDTGRLEAYTVDSRGVLHPASRREPHMWTPVQSGASMTGKVQDTDDEEATNFPLVNAIEADQILDTITRLADLVDPDRIVVPEIELKQTSVGLSLTEHSQSQSLSRFDSTFHADVKEALHLTLQAAQCPVCLAEFSSPTTLPCGHSVCRSHIAELTGKCPICREQFPRALYRESDRVNETLNTYKNALHKLMVLVEKNQVTAATK